MGPDDIELGEDVTVLATPHVCRHCRFWEHEYDVVGVCSYIVDPYAQEVPLFFQPAWLWTSKEAKLYTQATFGCQAWKVRTG